MNALNIVLESIRKMVETFLASIPQLVIATGVLLATWLVARIGSRVLKNTMNRLNLRHSLQDLFLKLGRLAAWTLGLMLAGTVVFPEFTPSKVLTVLGLGSVAIGFAFKDVFENFLAGILVLLREPFRLGDFIEVNDFAGRVEEVTIRDTHIRQSDGQRVVLPNAVLFKNPVRVATDLNQRRVTIDCGVGYGEDVARSRSIITRAVSGCEGVLSDKPVQIFAKAFGAKLPCVDLTWYSA